MPIIDITFGSKGTFTYAGGGPSALAQAILNDMTSTINTDNLLTGKVGGAAPTTNVGPWLNGMTWYAWDSVNSKYTPALIKIGGGGSSKFTVSLFSQPTANRTVTFQDKDGYVALLSDLSDPRPTVVLGSGQNNIDWSITTNYYKSISSNTVFTMNASLPGQEIWLVVKAAGGQTVTFPASVFWIGGSQPVQTSGGTDFYILNNIAGQIYGRVLQNYS